MPQENLKNDALNAIIKSFDIDAFKFKVETAIRSIKKATKDIASIAKGASTNFTITLNDDGEAIKNSIYIHGVVIIPSAATIFQIDFYGQNTRLMNDPLWYRHTYRYIDEDYANDVGGFWYFDVSESNTIWGRASIRTDGASAASFRVVVLYE